MYRSGQATSKEIAQRFHVSPATLTVWARKSRVPLRGRGRRAGVEPSAAIQLILLEAWTGSYAAAGVRFGVTKQRVGQLVKRWRAWAVAQFGQRKTRHHKTDQGQEQRAIAPVRPHVISFRIADSELTKLLAEGGTGSGPWARSPHSVARSCLLRFLEGAVEKERGYLKTVTPAP